MARKRILIEGWRGINHSYAMVNQNQILELIESDHDLHHYDLPFYRGQWNSIKNSSGFDADNQSKIFSLKTGEPSQAYDVVYRISFPYRLHQSNSEKLFVFGTAEFQNIDGYIYEDKLDQGIKNPQLKIITPSNWSKIGFLRAGFDESQVCVIPHGINPQVYKPISPERRKQFREALKLSDDDFLLLSLGAMTQNKGIDLLMLAYSILKEKYPHLRLVLKDSSNLYGLRAADVFRNHYINSNTVSENLFRSIISISDNLNQGQLNGLYGAADCYVSPYRAEGFNLTPLEAAASGTPIIITKGGSTDDYFHESFALQIDGSKICDGNKTFIEPSLDSLVDQIAGLIEKRANKLNQNIAQEFIENNFTWNKVVNKLLNLF